LICLKLKKTSQRQRSSSDSEQVEKYKTATALLNQLTGTFLKHKWQKNPGGGLIVKVTDEEKAQFKPSAIHDACTFIEYDKKNQRLYVKKRNIGRISQLNTTIQKTIDVITGNLKFQQNQPVEAVITAPAWATPQADTPPQTVNPESSWVVPISAAKVEKPTYQYDPEEYLEEPKTVEESNLSTSSTSDEETNKNKKPTEDEIKAMIENQREDERNEKEGVLHIKKAVEDATTTKQRRRTRKQQKVVPMTLQELPLPQEHQTLLNCAKHSRGFLGGLMNEYYFGQQHPDTKQNNNIIIFAAHVTLLRLFQAISVFKSRISSDQPDNDAKLAAKLRHGLMHKSYRLTNNEIIRLATQVT